jgi:hypothetical protein
MSVRPAAARLLRDAGDSLLAIVARDACVGDDVWQATALSVLGALVAADDTGEAVALLDQRGHLRVIADIATGASAMAVATAGDLTAVTRAVHLADVALAMLVRTAGAARGAGADKLEQCRVVPMLGQSPWLQLAAGGSVDTEAADGRQLVVPALRLVAALQTRRAEHVDLAAQVRSVSLSSLW